MHKQTLARLSGLTYLLLVITGIFSLLYVPSQIIDWTDPATTVSNIKHSEFLFRAGVAIGILCYIFYLVLPFLLYELFKDTNKNVAVFIIIFAAFSVPISLFNIVDKVNVLTVLDNAEHLKTLGSDYIEAQVMLLLKSYNYGIAVVQIFW